MSIIFVNLQDKRSVFQIFIALLRFSFDPPSFVAYVREMAEQFFSHLEIHCTNFEFGIVLLRTE